MIISKWFGGKKNAIARFGNLIDLRTVTECSDSPANWATTAHLSVSNAIYIQTSLSCDWFLGWQFFVYNLRIIYPVHVRLASVKLVWDDLNYNYITWAIVSSWLVGGNSITTKGSPGWRILLVSMISKDQHTKYTALSIRYPISIENYSTSRKSR